MSLGEGQYFVTFIDDYSRKVWIYILRTKNEVFLSFKEWKTAVENQTGKKIKCLRTDNGLEFCNNQMDELCKESGIKRHRTCTYTPQQNGVSERMNRSIMDKVRCMLSETGLEQKFWAEAASTAVYLINRSPNASIEYKLPEEVWTGTKPDLSNLRRFGCSAYVHKIQAKTEPRAVKGVFVGYPQGVKGYRVWIPEDLKCLISRDVVFHEEEVYKDFLKPKEQKTTKAKKVRFSSELIQGPSNQSVQAENFVQGGAIPETEGSDSESDENPEDHGNLNDYLLARDRDRREIKPPSRFMDTDYVAYAMSGAEVVDLEEPATYSEAKKSKDWKLWNGGMLEEMDSHKKNGTWNLEKLPEGKRVIGCKWIFTRKPGIPGVEGPRYKARLVAKGFSQVEGIDYTEVFAPVVKHVSIRLLLSAVANQDLELEQLDVKTAFLHGILEEEIYMSQPEGFEVKGKEDRVCRLVKSLYGLKQSPRQWNKRFDAFMQDQKFHRSLYDPCVYVQVSEGKEQVYLLIYVDDMLVASKDMKAIQELKNRLKEEFEMKDLGPASRILGMEIIRDRKKGILKLSQGRYLSQVLKTFNMFESKPVVTPIGSQFKLKSLNQEEAVTEAKLMEEIPYASAVGSLMYAMVGSRPDLAYAVGLVSRFMGNPGRSHWQAVKWIMRYLKGTLDLNLTFAKQAEFQVQGFCDADFAADLDRRRSITGYLFQVGGNTVSWRSGLQQIVALSTTESEYVSLTEAIKEATWLKGICSELGFVQTDVKVFCDAQSAICLAKNGVHHERTKHIDVKLHFIRDIIEKGEVLVEKIHTKINPADLLTKSVPGNRFEEGLVQLRMI